MKEKATASNSCPKPSQPESCKLSWVTQVSMISRAIVSGNLISNLPVSIANIDCAEKVFGPSLPILKGKTVRHSPKQVQSDYIVDPPGTKTWAYHIGRLERPTT